MPNVGYVDGRLSWPRARSVVFGDTQEYLHTIDQTSRLKISNRQEMIRNLVAVGRLEGVQPLTLRRPMIFWA